MALPFAVIVAQTFFKVPRMDTATAYWSSTLTNSDYSRNLSNLFTLSKYLNSSHLKKKPKEIFKYTSNDLPFASDKKESVYEKEVYRTVCSSLKCVTFV